MDIYFASITSDDNADVVFTLRARCGTQPPSREECLRVLDKLKVWIAEELDKLPQPVNP